MAWHRCSRYWKHNFSCPVRFMPGHEDEEEDDDDDDTDKPVVPIAERVPRVKPPERGAVVAVAEAIVREVQTRAVAVPAERVGATVPAVSVPEWVPSVEEIVVPSLYPSPADVAVGTPTPSGIATGSPPFGVPESTFGDSSVAVSPTRELPGPNPGPAFGDKIVEGTIAAGVGVGMAIAAASPLGWVQRIVTISRIMGSLAPQTGMIALPTARSLLVAAGAMTVRTVASKIPDQPAPDEPELELAREVIEELVVDYVMPMAAQRSVAISKALSGLTGRTEVETPLSEAPGGFSGYSDPYMDQWFPQLVSPPIQEAPWFNPDLRAEPEPATSEAGPGPGGHGYLYDFGNYLNSQLGTEGPIPGDASADQRVY